MPRPPTILQWTEGPFLKGDEIVDEDGVHGFVFGIRRHRDIATDAWGPYIYCANMVDGTSREAEKPTWTKVVPKIPSFAAHVVAALLNVWRPVIGGRADALAQTIVQEVTREVPRTDGWGRFSGDEADDRSALIAWLEKNAIESGMMCSPSWGRSFSLVFAQILREGTENVESDLLGVEIRAKERRQATVAKLREEGK